MVLFTDQVISLDYYMDPDLSLEHINKKPLKHFYFRRL